MITPRQNKLLISQSFASFEELAAIARAWNADFRQVSHSKMNHRILQVSMDGVLMSRGRFGCHLDQCGATPAGLRTFALFEADCPPVYWFSRRLGPDALLVFPASGEIDAISRPGFSAHTFSISIEQLGAFFERCKGPDIHRVLGPEPTVIPLAPMLLQRLRSHLRRISFDSTTLHQSLAMYDAYRDKLFDILLDIFNNSSSDDMAHRHHAQRQTIRDIISVVQQNRDENLSMEDLCAVGKLPQRTLNEMFRRELGISPGAFSKGYRLFGVHRELWHATSSRTRVTDIANAWGFWHMGQFAADYRKLFGELPSVTLAKHYKNK